MKNQNFVITSLQVWDIEIGSTIKNTALEMSKHNRVLFINTPMDHSTWLRKSQKRSYTQRMDVIKGRKPYVREIKENLWVVDCPFMVYSINKISNNTLFDFFNRTNNKKIARFINKVTRELGFDNYVHLIDNDIYRSQYLKEYIKPAISIYYKRDNVMGEVYWRRHGTRLEPQISARADIVIANSLYYAEISRESNPNSIDVGAGVSLDMYDHRKEYTMPSDMATIPRPIVGYVGSINSTRLDADLLKKVAEQRPDYSFVFTGPEDAVFKAHALHTLANVHFLGNKRPDELAQYIHYYDVCINPQMVNTNTIGNYPLKIDEYLAMGKPIVATSTHTMEHIFSKYVHLATNFEEYCTLIDKAIAESGDEELHRRRIEFAHTHSWENNVKRIYEVIEDYQAKNR